MKTKTYNAAIYVRLSKEDGDDAKKTESNSISNQKSLILNFLKDKDDIRAVSTFVDDGYTGSNFNRPGFRSMVEAIETGNINCVVVKDLSRFGREYITAGNFIQRVFPALGVRFIAINDNVDTIDMLNPANEIVIPFKNLVNDAFCMDTSIKIRSQLDEKRRQGEFVGNFCPYGYRKDPKNHNRLIPDDEAAFTVKRIFSMIQDGLSPRAISYRLNADGIKSPMKYKESLGLRYSCNFTTSDSPKWSPVTVRRIAMNPVYTGKLVQGAVSTPSHKVKKRIAHDGDDRVTVENTHEAIINIKVFETVQRLLDTDMRTAPGRRDVYLMSGVCRCADCGSVMTRKISRSKGHKYVYYICSNYKRFGTCTPHRIREDRLEAIITNASKFRKYSNTEKPDRKAVVNLIREVRVFEDNRVEVEFEYGDGFVKVPAPERQVMRNETVAFYIRLSKSDMEVVNGTKDESNSITGQRALLSAYLRDREEFAGCDVVEYFDDGISGSVFAGRDSFQAMLKDARDGRFSCLMVKDFSRLGRDYIQVGRFMEYVFPAMGLRFISVNDNYDSKKRNGLAGGMDVAFKNLIHQMYAIDGSRKVKYARRIRNERGEYTSGLVPYGYRKDPMDEHRLIINDEEAAVVREIFTLAGNGYGYTHIARILNDRGEPTPYEKKMQGFPNGGRGNSRHSDYRVWQVSAIREIVRNAAYKGQMVQNRFENVGYGDAKKSVRTYKDRWSIVDDAIPAIINAELFNRANKSKKRSPVRVSHKRETNLFVCGHCGRKLVKSSENGRYYCKVRTVKSHTPCAAVNMRINDAKQLTLKTVKDIVLRIINDKNCSGRTVGIDDEALLECSILKEYDPDALAKVLDKVVIYDDQHLKVVLRGG